MVNGPSISGTPAGVRKLVRQHLGLVERGLQPICEDLELGNGGRVDVLAADLTGAPVLVFAVSPSEAGKLTSRLVNAAAWFRQHGPMLEPQLPEAKINLEASPRLLVLGVEILADTMQDIMGLGLESLQVYQFCQFTVARETHVGLAPLTPVTGTGSGPGPLVNDNGQPPEGLRDEGDRQLCKQFLDRAAMMDDRISVDGDRFSRRLLLGGRSLGVLEVNAQGMQFAMEEGAVLPLQCEEDSVDLLDHLLRSLLPPLPTREPALSGSYTAGTLATGVEEDRFSLEPIRQSVAASKLSADEYAALDEPGVDS